MSGLASGPGGLAIYAPGYWQPVNPSAVTAAQKAFGAAVSLTQAEFDSLRNLCLNGQTAVDAEIASLPAQIPLTVEGASEQFITSQMQQVVANANQNTANLNGFNVTIRDQVKAWVTSEANRVIAAQ